MCLILFAWDVHPQYKLVLLGNRDEFYRRPTAKADFWNDAPEVFAGRDLQAGGTWMGLNKNGKFSAVTNYRDFERFKPSTGFRSRGALVADYLKEEKSAEDYGKILEKEPELYDGYNLLTGDFQNLFFFSNIEKKVKKIEPGIYGLSNHLLNTPWPKVVKGKNILSEVLHQMDFDDLQLIQMLYNVDHALDEELPDTGVGPELERKLSSMFIKMDDYGTRRTSLLKISRDGKYYFTERTFDPDGAVEDVSVTIDI
ncbi:NRDE family protein [soil metagenome]